MSSSQMAQGACLTDTVKSLVQQNSLGLLSGTSGLSYIKVHYYQPPDPSTGGALVDVSAQSTGNTPGNIMQVSVTNYNVNPLFPRVFAGSNPDDSPVNVNVYSADLIESQGGSTPCIGTAP